MSPILHSVSCPVCDGDVPKRLGLAETSEKTRDLGIDGVHVVRCFRCGLFYADPMPAWTVADLAALYDHDYYPAMTAWWENIRARVNPVRRLGALQHYCGSSISRFLEVGCGPGYALKEALRRGWQAYGQDVSPVASSVGASLGIDVFIGPLEQGPYADSSFDAVYLDSVIEHLPTPVAFLRELWRLLKPGGCAYIVCPNADSLASVFMEFWARLRSSDRSARICPLRPPYHVVGFGPHAMRWAAERAGFAVVQILVDKDYQTRRFSQRLMASRPPGLRAGLKQAGWTVVYWLGERAGRGMNLEAILRKPNTGGRSCCTSDFSR
ncbi:MAG: class I SAM-dependent methyltransferase [Chloroflexota bacterium]|nr:MAG: class I SAM-dependent methyltransferase [Chloroflexota bacterium]